MSFNKDIDAIQVRIAKAESDRDAWRTSGMQEKYLEAYTRVEALELELDRLRKQGVASLASNDAFIGPLLMASPLNAQIAPPHVAGEWQQLMTRLASSRRLKDAKP